MAKSRQVASRASTSIVAEESGISAVCSLPLCRIVIANLAKGALSAVTFSVFCSCTCAMLTTPGVGIILPPASSGWGREPFFRRKLIPNLEHVTASEPTVTSSRLAISWRLTPCTTQSLIFSITCGVNFTLLPLVEGAFVMVMAAPVGSPRPLLVPDYGFGRCDGHHEMVDFRSRGS